MIHTEVAQGGTEEHRGQLAGQKTLQVEFVAGTLHQFQCLAQFFRVVRADGLVQLRIVQPFHFAHVLHGVALASLVENGGVGEQVIDALEALAHTDGPGHRGALDLEHVLDFIQHFNAVADIPVQLVDEGQDRRVPQATHFHQLDGPLLHALGGINHHQRRIHGGEGAIGIFGEVGVAGGIQQVDRGPLVGKLHHRGGHGNAPLLLHLHPVGGGVFAGLLALNGTGTLDQVSVQQQLFGNGGFTGVRVRNDREGAALGHLVLQAHGVPTLTGYLRGASIAALRIRISG